MWYQRSEMEELKNIIGFIKIDFFESQVWERKYPMLKGRRFVIADISGKVLTVSVEAAKFGVTLDKSLQEAELMCPDMTVVFKPEGSWDDKKLRWETGQIITSFCELRSIPFQSFPPDEWYFDLTENVRYQILQNRMTHKSTDLFPPDFNDSINIHLEHSRPYGRPEIDKLLKCYTQALDHHNPLQLDESEGQTFKLMSSPINPAWNFLSEGDIFFLSIVFGGSILNNLMNELEVSVKIKCSASLASNMLQAKLASNLYPHGRTLTLLTNLGFRRVASQISVFSIPGLDEECKRDLQRHFPSNLQELAQIPLSTFIARFSYNTALLIYNTSKGLCNKSINTDPFLNEITFANYKLCIVKNKELRVHLELLLRQMVKKLNIEIITRKRQTKKLKIRFSCCDVWGTEDAFAEFDVDFHKERRQSDISPIAQRCYREICKHRGFDSKFRTITSLEITSGQFFPVV